MSWVVNCACTIATGIAIKNIELISNWMINALKIDFKSDSDSAARKAAKGKI